MKYVGNLKLISTGFLIFYGITLLSYFRLVGHPTVGVYSSVISFLFTLAIAGVVGVLQWREWGRQLLVFSNMFVFFYGLAIWQRNPDLMPMPYLVIALITAVFYNQRQTRAYFQPLSQLVRKSILIVDDDEGLLKTVQKILLGNGYSVLTANTGEKGLQIARNQRPDLIILDVLLPGIKGREVCAILKEDPGTKLIPVIFLTAKDSPDDIEAEVAVGGQAHLVKPVNAKILLAEVKKNLE